MTPKTINDVVEMQICSGCGACAAFAPGVLEMVDVPEAGRRPRVRVGAVANGELTRAMAVCPGHSLEHTYDGRDPELARELTDAWGPVYQLWEGHAADEELRYAGSSGGAASALSLYALEREGMHGVLHTAAREDAPHLNRTVMSRTREELLGRTGSRYAPASPCEGLGRIAEAEGPCVFLGKPCDAAAAAKARGHWGALDEKLGLTIAFFCAGTPSTRGTLEMLRRMGIDDPSALRELRYRGNGWPGRATAVLETGAGLEKRELTYEQSWGEVLQKHRQWRCYVCADHTGEFADIAVGDPWHRPTDGNPGSSLILARTRRGRAFIEAAIEAGYLRAELAAPRVLPDAQPNLLRVRGAIWGRILVLRLMGAAWPRYRRLPMFRHWLGRLSLKEKAQSIYGTVKRVFTKRLLYRVSMEETPAAQRGKA